MAHVKLRPLVVVADPAGSQPIYCDTMSPEGSNSNRTHCGLPSPSRTSKSLAPAPPDHGSSGADENSGVSKLRSKLRRLLGAHSSSNPSNANSNVDESACGVYPSSSGHSHTSQGRTSFQHPSAASAMAQVTSLRSASSHDLNERPGSTHGRGHISVPLSPLPGGASTRGRFSSTNAPLAGSPSAGTPPATPGSGCNTPAAPGTTRTVTVGPTPPSAASPSAVAGGTAGRSPGGSTGGRSGATLRRAVSFSPANTTFPPLNAPSPPPVPPGAASRGPAVEAAAGTGPTGPSRPSSTSSLSFVASSRLSNMVVVPEEEALLTEHHGRVELSDISATGNNTNYINNNNNNHYNGSNGGAAGGGASRVIAAAAKYGNGGGADGLDVAFAASPSGVDVGGAAILTSPVGGSARQGAGGGGGGVLRPSSPFGSDPRRATRSSSSNNYLGSSNGYIVPSAALAAVAGSVSTPGGPTAVAVPAADRDSGGSTGQLVSWQSDAAVGPFAAATDAAVAALTEAQSVPGPGAGGAARLGMTLKNFMARPETLRRPSSPTVTSGASPRVGAHSPLPASAAGVTVQAALAGHALSLGNSSSGQVPSIPGLTRGMSAFNLLPSGASIRGGLGTASSSPWNTLGGASAAAALSPTPAAALAAAVAAADYNDHAASAAAAAAVATAAATLVVPGSSSLPTTTAPVQSVGTGHHHQAGGQGGLKQAPIRRAFSTVDSTARVQQDAPAQSPGVVLALGASIPSDMRRKEWRLEDFTMLKRLYKGNYSSVHKALCRTSMRLVVIKVYDTTRMTELARNHVKREATLHAPLEHDNILNLYSVFSQGPNVMLVEEVAEGGDLYHVLKGVPGHRLQEDRAVAGVLVPLLRALAYLHEQGICHRDIKLENILFSDRHHTRMLLADFGIALSLRHERAVTRAGTTEYMSPEQLRCPFKRHPGDNKDRADLHYGLEVDVWASGVLAYELLHGYPPFLGNSREETEALIVSADVVVAPQLSAGARDFVLSCLQKDPMDRPTVHQLLQHTWIRQHARQLRVGA